MSNSEVLGMVGYLLFYASVGLGALVAVCLVVKQLSGYLKERYGDPRQSTVVDRCNVYSLRPGEDRAPVPRQRPSMFVVPVTSRDSDDWPAA